MLNDMRGKRVTVMGLGLHGGGVQSALFFAKCGSQVTVTDLKNENLLKPSINKLKEFPVRFVLGKHREEDFLHTDLIIKNPGIPKNSHFLSLARQKGIPVETDISIFLALSNNPIIAVTGSKGKSTISSALYYCLKKVFPNSFLGGNITVSPLSFLNELKPQSPLVLELSSWQLSDLDGNKRFKPRISLITNILPDHMNWYSNMEEYIYDKKIIYQNQDENDYSILNFDCQYKEHYIDSKAKVYYFSQTSFPDNRDGAWLEGKKGFLKFNGKTTQILDDKMMLTGEYNRVNLLSAGLALFLFGIEAVTIRKELSSFSGIEHRLELFLKHRGIKYYNDSAATIPQATVAATDSLKSPIFLITGGTDKNLDFSPMVKAFKNCDKIFLLNGSGTEKMISLLNESGISYSGPFNTLEDTLKSLKGQLFSGVSVLFSPGCASFGMFNNEFDRGEKFKKTVLKLNNKLENIIYEK